MSEPAARALTDAEVLALADALDHWAAQHPAREEPLLAFGFYIPRPLSPDDIARAVRNHAMGERNSAAELILRLFRFGREIKPLEAMLDELWQTATSPEAPGETVE